jgi:hypothetical protein
MAFVWNIYERVSDVLGPEATAIAVVVAVAVASYYFMGATRPST